MLDTGEVMRRSASRMCATLGVGGTTLCSTLARGSDSTLSVWGATLCSESGERALPPTHIFCG
eukprot:462433-Rhodomonas_salina.1